MADHFVHDCKCCYSGSNGDDDFEDLFRFGIFTGKLTIMFLRFVVVLFYLVAVCGALEGQSGRATVVNDPVPVFPIGEPPYSCYRIPAIVALPGGDMDIAFNNVHNRRLELRIREKTPENDWFPLLAPVDSDVQRPDRLFLAFMFGFDFVIRDGTVFHARIGDRTLIPATFPISRNSQAVYFARNATRPVIGIVNCDGERALEVSCMPGQDSF